MTARIIAFVNGRYVPVARNWLSHLRACGLAAKATLVTLDDQARRAFPAHRVMHRPLQADTLRALWCHRIEVFKDLLGNGEAFVHSDVDAVWRANPWPQIAECDAEIVFSQGTTFPPDVHGLHRVVLCCGFFSLTPTAAVLEFMDRVALRVAEDRDDQTSVNRVVATMIDGWRITEPYEIPFRGTRFLASRHPMHAVPRPGLAGVPSVAVLPHHRFPRLLDSVGPDVVVAHPLSGKTCADKRQCLSALGLWCADADLDNLE